MARPPRPKHPGRAIRGIRGHSALAALLVVAVALLGGVIAFLLLLQRELITAARTDAYAQAGELVSQIREGGLSSIDEQIDAATGARQVIQVIDASGHVVSASTRRVSQKPLTRISVAPGDIVDVRSDGLALLQEDPYLIVVAGVSSAGRGYRVVVATSIGAQQESVETALSLLMIGAPVLLLLVGAATWLLVGRTLRPIELMRRRVSEIGVTSIDERLSVPATDDEIARLAETLNEMLERIDHAYRTQRRFVADASHELRSPLSTLAASVELARTDISGRTWRDLAPVIDGEVDRMTRLVSDLLLLAKADEIGVPLRLEDVDLDDLADSEVRRLRALKNLLIDHDLSPARVVGDAGKLSQVVRNLGDNAALHARSRVRITIKVEGKGTNCTAMMYVDDDGPGVPVTERERVFERFVRLDDSRDRARGGSGLGLAIVREIVRAHQGTVLVTSSEWGGCRVELRIPAEDLG